MDRIYFNKLNYLENSKAIIGIKTVDDNDKLIDIKKLFAEKSNVLLKNYNIYFCSNQYELYNLLIFSIIKSFAKIHDIPNVICSTMEHPNILSILDIYKKDNLITVSMAGANIYGSIPVSNVKDLITPSTCLIIVSFSNYLIGTLNDIKLIGEIAHKSNIPLFSDTIYSFGKCDFKPMENNIDIFSADFCKKDLCLLAINKDLVSGYKLKHQSIKFQTDKSIKITSKDYKSVIATLDNIKLDAFKKKNNLLKKYLLDNLKKHCIGLKSTLLFYNDVVKNNIIPKSNDLIVLGHLDLTKSIPDTVSFIYMHSTKTALETKLKKNNIFISDLNTNLFEKIGILEKYAKRVITINLSSCVKSDINYFIKML